MLSSMARTLSDSVGHGACLTACDNVRNGLTFRKGWRISVRSQAAAWLQGHIDRLQLTHEQIAERSDVKRQTISAILNQRNDPNDETLAKLAKAFGVPAPRAERVLVFEGEVPTALDLVRLAQATLEEAAGLMGAPILPARLEAIVQRGIKEDVSATRPTSDPIGVQVVKAGQAAKQRGGPERRTRRGTGE